MNRLFQIGIVFAMASVGIVQAENYPLKSVKGIQAFGGSAAARELLAKNGFVVADPSFKQIFEAYIRSPQTKAPSLQDREGESLPSFITTDSAWHTYHVLLEEAVKQLEEIQSGRLAEFSRALLDAAKKQNTPELAFYFSVGLAWQDEKHRASLSGDEKRIVDALRLGVGVIEAPIGFPLSAAQFRARSFYTQSPALSDYFAARQWYASVIFRLSNLRETRLALALAKLISNDPKLFTLWAQLSDPMDALLAPAEDGSVREYSKAGHGETPTSDSAVAEIQKRLAAQLPFPRVSDQLLSPEDYQRANQETRGFRLLPSRPLPDSVCFHNTTDPKIPQRAYPSGLDFFAACTIVRSPTAERALRSQFGDNVGDLVLKADCGPMPNSIHGEAMQLLATLQKPVPSQAPRVFHSEQWFDLQLWTQLAAWAEQRHTWALHSKLAVSYAGIVTPPKGMVAPYPEFFSGLAILSRHTASALEKAGFAQAFDVKALAAELLAILTEAENPTISSARSNPQKAAEKAQQYGAFVSRYFEKHQAELEKAGSDAHRGFEKRVVDITRRATAGAELSSEDTETIRLYYDSRQDIAQLMNRFAEVCNHLAILAKKSIDSKPITDEEARWIENYGITLAGLHFYYGNSYEVPQDDFPIVTRIFSNPRADSMLYGGVARPQALYVIVPNGKTLQLYRGAVLTYREFVRPNNQLLDDDSWRELISKGQAPPAPPFTRVFYAETSVAELLKKVHAQAEDDNSSYGDIRDTLWQINARATEKDLPTLIETFTRALDPERSDVLEGIGEIIARLPWGSEQKLFIQMLAATNHVVADASARILIAQPALINPSLLIDVFSKQSTRARRLYCAILSRLPAQTDATRKLLLEALHDKADGVRWQAALAIARAEWNNSQSQAALLDRLGDSNELVGAAAVHALVRLKATNTAPGLLAKLKTRLNAATSPRRDFKSDSLAIRHDIHDENHAERLLDDAHLSVRLIEVPERARQMAAMRLPQQVVRFENHNYNLADALIEALGELHYAPATDELFKLRGADYHAEATAALKKLAPDRLSAELIADARDNKKDSYDREQALIALANTASTNRVREVAALLDDTTAITYSRPLPGPPWRICDRAALTMASLLGWRPASIPMFIPPEEREKLLNRAREWASQNQ